MLRSASARSVIDPLLFPHSPSLGYRESRAPAPLGETCQLSVVCSLTSAWSRCALRDPGTPSLGKRLYVLSSKSPHVSEGRVLSRYERATHEMPACLQSGKYAYYGNNMPTYTVNAMLSM